MLESDGPNPVDLVALSRALGNLEATTEALKAGQEDIRESLRDINRRFDEVTRRYDDNNRRINRLYYAIIGMGSALIIAVLASNFLGN